MQRAVTVLTGVPANIENKDFGFFYEGGGEPDW